MTSHCAWAPSSTTRRDGQRDQAVFADALGMAAHAELLGYDSVWLTEHHFIDYGRCPAPLTMAPFILGRTRRIRAGRWLERT